MCWGRTIRYSVHPFRQRFERGFSVPILLLLDRLFQIVSNIVLCSTASGVNGLSRATHCVFVGLCRSLMSYPVLLCTFILNSLKLVGRKRVFECGFVNLVVDWRGPQAHRIRAIHRIVVAITVQVIVTGGELFRVGLEEAAHLRVIQTVPIIVELQVAQILSPYEQEAVSGG